MLAVDCQVVSCQRAPSCLAPIPGEIWG